MTESIDVIANSEGKIIVTIDNMSYFIPIKQTPTRISFNNIGTKYIGLQNSYLAKMNGRTVNFSRMNGISIVEVGCKIIKIYQNYYETYKYPSREVMFV
jgi:hypothetical protein